MRLLTAFRLWTMDQEDVIQARLDLKAWKRALPSALRMEDVSAASPSYRATFHLHLNYYFAWIAMGKYKVVSIVRNRLRHALGGGPDLDSTETKFEQLSRSCMKAARKMLVMFGQICTSGKLTRSSFTDFQGCSIATMVLLIAGIVERDICYEANIFFGLQCLRKMAGEHTTAVTGVSFMEALQATADEASQKLHDAETRGRQTMLRSPSRMRDFDGWAQWLSQQASQSDASNGRRDDPSATEGTIPDFGGSLAPPFQLPLLADQAPYTLDGTSRQSATNTRGDGIPEIPTDAAWTQTDQVDSDLFSFLHVENEAFLMELTGLEALGLSGS